MPTYFTVDQETTELTPLHREPFDDFGTTTLSTDIVSPLSRFPKGKPYNEQSIWSLNTTNLREQCKGVHG